MKQIKAIFKGQDGSCGYETGKEYTLIIYQGYKEAQIQIENKDTVLFINGSGHCEYESMISFLKNWDNIRRISEEKREPLFITEDEVEIFQKDKYWYLSEDLNAVYEMGSAFKGFMTDGTIRFSTEQVAKDWIVSRKKPKSLKPEELVDGEIYVDAEGYLSPRPIRFWRKSDNGKIDLYSQIRGDRVYVGVCCYYHPDFIRSATLAEKQTLIKAEVEHGYFHELKNHKQ